jgi:hypothetical protein
MGRPTVALHDEPHRRETSRPTQTSLTDATIASIEKPIGELAALIAHYRSLIQTQTGTVTAPAAPPGVAPSPPR